MSLNRRKNIWWVGFTTPNGKRIRESTGTVDKKEAQEFHDNLKAEYWRVNKLGEKPRKQWQEAVLKFLSESQHKASLEAIKGALRWSNTYLKDCYLDDVTRDMIDTLTSEKLKTDVTNATVNRMLETIRAVLRKACYDWEWLDKVPKIRMLPEPKRRIRYLERVDAKKLLAELPTHLEAMVRFSLATGLRQANVTQLQWSQVNIEKKLAWINPDQAKARKAIPVPLNSDALKVLAKQKDLHPEYVFPFRGNPVVQVNTKAWKNALKRAGIENFRWHDLRHTWASWHVQDGTPLNVLQELGGWESVEMVRRYAHLNADHLSNYAEAVSL